MEYIQTILFQIPASRLEEASAGGGLLAELDEHRQFLKGQAGFRDIRITRSINNEGNILVMTETRWSDDGSLVRYETNEPNAATIVRKHDAVLVPGSLQVLDMEALRTESSFKHGDEATDARARTILPIAIPFAVLAFALLAIYGLSRVYLEIRGDGAVALATGLAIGVMIFALYFAANPKAPGWQIGAVVALLAVSLAGGTVWAVANEDEVHEEAGVEEPGGGGEPGGGEAPSGSPEPGAGGLVLSMKDNFFEFDGEQNPAITVTAGEETVFEAPNEGAAIHNVHVAIADDFDTCSPDGNDPCTDPDTVRGGQDSTLTITLEAGEYKFQCDFHPTEMTGTFIAE